MTAARLGYFEQVSGAQAEDRRAQLGAIARHLGETAHYQVGVVGISLQTSIRRLHRQYATAYGAHAVEQPVHNSIRIEVRRTPLSLVHRRRFEVVANSHCQFLPTRMDAVLPHVEWAVSWQLPHVMPEYLQLHAAALEFRGQGLILAGQAGAGKSTLTVGLVRRGWNYLCDEFALIHAHDLNLRSYPRAICIKETGFGVLKDLGVGVDQGYCFSKGSKGAVTFLRAETVRADSLGVACPLRWVVFPTYAAGAEPELTPISRGEAAFALHEVCFNLNQCERLGLDVLAEAVRGARCFRLRTGDLTRSCELLEHMADESAQ